MGADFPVLSFCFIYPLPLEGECPKGKGLADGERPKPTSAPSGHLLPREGGKKRSGIAPIYAALLIFCAEPRTLNPEPNLCF